MDGICSSTSRLQQPSIVSNASIQQWPYLHDVECQYTRVLLFQCVPRSTRRRSLWESFYFISSLSLLGGTIASHASTTSLLHAVNRKIQNKCQKQGQKGRKGKYFEILKWVLLVWRWVFLWLNFKNNLFFDRFFTSSHFVSSGSLALDGWRYNYVQSTYLLQHSIDR